ncbi:MAG: NAD(P)H-quinone dehydrogenase [Actinomycetota bacterium]|nr:NAD(P)H-quinone dehydrogenase [Actinomycetota bacterium]
MTEEDHRPRFLILGAGPAGNSAATTAASLGARVVLVEPAIVGGAAHLWDCIPSKTMVATSARLEAVRHAGRLGLSTEGAGVDLDRLAERMAAITGNLQGGLLDLLASQGVQIIEGWGRFRDPHSVEVPSEGGPHGFTFDLALIATGSSPRVPEWAEPDGERILTTRQAYDLPELPEHLVIIGSGVTGVEFVHIFSSLGSRVTLLVSRQQVLPHRDAEVAAVLEEDFLERGVALLKGARATAARRTDDRVVVETEDGRRVEASHVLLAIGSVPMSEELGLDAAGVKTEHGYVVVDEYQRTTVPSIYAAGDVTGQMPLSSVAAMQGRKIARHALGYPVKPLDYQKVSQAVFTEPEIASVGLEEAEAASEGRKVRITKVPFAANPRALIQGNPRGFVKVISDPATRVVLGGTVVGHHASELISVMALAVQAQLRVDSLVETLMVHPSLSESLTDAAE